METYFAFCVSNDVVRMLVLIIAENSVYSLSRLVVLASGLGRVRT